MKTKKHFFYLTFLFLLAGDVISQQAIIEYLGQTPPGNTPEIFAPGIISMPDRFEQYTIWSPDGMDFFHQISDHTWDWSESYCAYYDDNEWINSLKMDSGAVVPDGMPEMFFTMGFGLGSAMSADGKYAYTLKDGNIWRSEKKDTGWTAPVNLNLPIPAGAFIQWISVADNQNIYVTLDIAAPHVYTIYRSKKLGDTYGELENMYSKFHHELAYFHFIAPDESYVILTQYNTPGGYGIHDLWISYHEGNDNWTNPVNMGPTINSNIHDMAAYVTPDGKYMFYSTRGSSTNSDIYWVSAGIIDTIRNSYFSPYVRTRIPDQTDTTGKYFTYTIPDSAFIDYDDSLTLTLTASLINSNDLPESLEFNSQTNTLSGILKEAGIFDIIVTATGSVGASVTDTFKLTVKEGSSRIVNPDVNELVLFPNPASETIQIMSDGLLFENTSYQIFDISGNTAKLGRLIANKIDVADLSKGIYVLKLTDKQKAYVKKIMIE